MAKQQIIDTMSTAKNVQHWNELRKNILDELIPNSEEWRGALSVIDHGLCVQVLKDKSNE